MWQYKTAMPKLYNPPRARGTETRAAAGGRGQQIERVWVKNHFKAFGLPRLKYLRCGGRCHVDWGTERVLMILTAPRRQ